MLKKKKNMIQHAPSEPINLPSVGMIYSKGPGSSGKFVQMTSDIPQLPTHAPERASPQHSTVVCILDPEDQVHKYREVRCDFTRALARKSSRL